MAGQIPADTAVGPAPLQAALADRYRFERQLGRGGMATVYLAHDLKHHRKVAIKVLKPELAAMLGPERFLREVATLLEGSVRRAGDRVRIVAQLIDASADQHLWAETYDRQLTDIFAIQMDVALQIASALRAELSPDEQTRIRRKPTSDVDEKGTSVKPYKVPGTSYRGDRGQRHGGLHRLRWEAGFRGSAETRRRVTSGSKQVGINETCGTRSETNCLRADKAEGSAASPFIS